MQEVTKLLVRCDDIGIYGALTAAVVIETPPEGATVTALSKTTGIASPTIKYHILRAVARKWLAPSNTYHRTARVYYRTPRGNQMVERISNAKIRS